MNNCYASGCEKDAYKCGQEKKEYRPTPKNLIVGPVEAHAYGEIGSIYDAEGNKILDIRGWGRLQYFENAEKLQDGMCEWIAEAINERLKTHPATPELLLTNPNE